MPNKDLAYYMALPYTLELIPDEDGYWFARIPLLEGCMTNGESREDALRMLDDAKQLWLETALQLGKSIPEPELHEIGG
ncbi:MAG: type II toxin-antitoxin system HicB family antitoxin [Anaerolineae bacterium]|nr:type II toxin-antitoxin system HicB family antitoxin [Anaerolineae bacterium]